MPPPHDAGAPQCLDPRYATVLSGGYGTESKNVNINNNNDSTNNDNNNNENNENETYCRLCTSLGSFLEFEGVEHRSRTQASPGTSRTEDACLRSIL